MVRSVSAADHQALQELAEEHVRRRFRPDSVPLLLADELTMAHFRSKIALELGPGALIRRPPRRIPLPAPGFHLYRLWSADGRLLYVGISTNLPARIRVHRARWGDLIDRVTWEEHPDERAMLAAERRAITDEDPAFNKASIG